MPGYTRADTTNQIDNGNVIDATTLDLEFEAVQSAFGAVNGHRHNGSVGEGAPITVVGPAQDIVINGTTALPKTTNVMSLGNTTFRFKDLWLAGIATINSLVATTVSILGGTINNTSVGATTASTVRGTTITATTGFVGPLTGAVTGDVTGALTGNASTATALQTARTINGTSFNGTANITTTNWGTSRTLTIGATGKAVDGSANVSWTVGELGVGTLGTQNSTAVSITGGTINGTTIGNVTASPITGTTITGTSLVGPLTGNVTGAVTGNASTATTLQTARTINGVSFNGSANITVTANTPQVLTAGDGVTSTGTFNGGTARTFSVDSTVVRTTGAQTIAGLKTFSDTVTGPTFNATSVTDGGFQGIATDTAAIPSFTWSSDLDTGMWRSGVDTIGFTTGGVNRITINSAGISGAGAGLTGVNAAQLGGVALSGVVQTSRSVATSTGLTGGGDLTADRTLALTGQALALHNLATNGLIARTGAGTVAGRTIVGGTGITVTNGNGVSANPDISATTATFAQALAADDNTVLMTPLRMRDTFAAYGTAPMFACRAWVNFNGTGTVAIRASGNVSSITDNGTGDYTVNFTTALSDANYAVQLSNRGDANPFTIRIHPSVNPTTSALRIVSQQISGTPVDDGMIHVAIFR